MPSIPNLRTRLSCLILLAFLPALIGLVADGALSRNPVLPASRTQMADDPPHVAAIQERWLPERSRAAGPAPHAAAAMPRAEARPDPTWWPLAADLAAICVGLLLALLLLERWIVRDMLALKTFAEAAGSERPVPPPRPAHASEIRAASDAVGAMAAKFQEQGHSLLKLHAELREANATLESRVNERTRELERSERLYRALAESIPQIVWYGTAADGIMYVNHAWRELLGDDGDSRLGFGWLELVHPDDRQLAERLNAEAIATGKPFKGQFRVRLHDGAYRHYLIKAAPLLGEGEYGPHQVWAGVGTDVTELKKSEETLQLANDELQSFSYSVSHDLRAPLVAIKGFSGVLLEDFGGELDRQARHYLERIHASSQHMSGLIDDLLKLAQFSVMESHCTAIDISALCEEVAVAQREAEPQRVVEMEIAPGMQACADRRLLRIALTNLIGNAWKFTRPVSHPRVRIACRSQDGEQVFCISDNGTGFDMRHADKLFGAFQRLHGKEFPGTGIGLATVRRIILRHGGRVWAEASPRRGADFFFTLPDRQGHD